MRILITGIHGFVGGNLVRTLYKDHELYGLDIVYPEAAGVTTTFNWEEMDSVPRVEAIIHLAGKAHDTRNTTGSQSYFDINIGLTIKIFDFFLQSDAEKFIFFSSVKAIADTVAGDILSEKEIPKPQTLYGQSKLAAEQYILSRLNDNDHHSPTITLQPNDYLKPETCNLKPATLNPKKVYILRPCMIHGPGNKGNLNLLFSLVQKNIPWPLGNFENHRSFCSIDNVNFIIQQLIEKNIPSGIFQVADDQFLSTNQLVTLMAESLGKKAHIWNLNQKLIRKFAKAGDLLHLPLNTERLKKLTESYLVSNQKLKNALGIEEMPINAIDGMKKTLNSFRENI